MDKIFARAMGMSQEEMVAQKEWEQEHADDPTDSDAEDEPTVVRPAKKHPKKGKKKGTINDDGLVRGLWGRVVPGAAPPTASGS